MQNLKTEGIILKVIDFGEYDQIMTVFTRERGIIKLIFKKKKPSQENPMVKISPLVRAEFIYSETKGGIWKCREISTFNHYLKLRENYAWLESAARLINCILISQEEQKPAPKLYQLLTLYLEKIPLTSNLHSLEISFMALILKHEGLINVDLHCSLCQKPLHSLHISRGDHFCSIHAPLDAFVLDDAETLAWLQIIASQTFTELQSVTIPSSLPPKIENLFKSLIH